MNPEDTFHEAVLLLLYPLTGHILMFSLATDSTVDDDSGKSSGETSGGMDACERTKVRLL